MAALRTLAGHNRPFVLRLRTERKEIDELFSSRAERNQLERATEISFDPNKKSDKNSENQNSDGHSSDHIGVEKIRPCLLYTSPSPRD